MPHLIVDSWIKYRAARGWSVEQLMAAIGSGSYRAVTLATKYAAGPKTELSPHEADRFAELVGEDDALLLLDTGKSPWLPPSQYDERYPHLARWRQGLVQEPEPAPWGPVYEGDPGRWVGVREGRASFYSLDPAAMKRELEEARITGLQPWMQGNQWRYTVPASGTSRVDRNGQDRAAPPGWVQTWCYLVGYERVLALLEPESLATHVRLMREGAEPRTVYADDLWPPYSEGLERNPGAVNAAGRRAARAR